MHHNTNAAQKHNNTMCECAVLVVDTPQRHSSTKRHITAKHNTAQNAIAQHSTKHHTENHSAIQYSKTNHSNKAKYSTTTKRNTAQQQT